MRRYLLLIFAAFLLVSCAREWEPEEVLTDDGLVERTWTVEMNDETRATLDESLRPVWEVGEQLSVYDHHAKVGRIFEVTSVDGRTATITGKVTRGGDIPFDAVYPARSAGEWSSDGTNTLELPDTQVIPSGRNVCPHVLVSTAHSDSPEGVVSFHNISSLLKVDVARDDISEINIYLVDPSADETFRYKAAAETGALAKGTYFVAVDPGSYDGGLRVICSDGFGHEYHKFSTTPLEATAGGIKNLGTVSDGTFRYHYKITNERREYSSQSALLDATHLLGNLGLLDQVLLNAFLSSNFSNRSTPVKAISYNYLSADPQGKPVELSAVIYIRSAILIGMNKLAGIALANHGTIASNNECPTRKAQAEGAFAWKDYAIVMPDYYGFGASSDRPQAYLDSETTARGSVDAYLAAVQLLTDKGVRIPSNSISVGYSQGGFNSMANLKYVTEHPELDVTFTKVICGGSPFDVGLTWEAYIEENYRNAIGFVPLAMVSMNESQQLGIPYEHIFKKTLLEPVGDGNPKARWEEWILSKKYDLDTINGFLGTDDLSDIMSDEIMARTGQYWARIEETCRRYSLTSGWTPPSTGTEIVIYHSTNDDIVPYGNFTAMDNYLRKTIPGKYTSISSKDGGHVDACISFIQNTINKW